MEARWKHLSLGLCLALCVGCSGGIAKIPLVPAGGTVTLDGEPLATGSIELLPVGGGTETKVRMARGEVNNGEFTLGTYDPGDGVAVGKYRVRLIQNSTTGLDINGTPIEEVEVVIPEEGDSALLVNAVSAKKKKGSADLTGGKPNLSSGASTSLQPRK